MENRHILRTSIYKETLMYAEKKEEPHTHTFVNRIVGCRCNYRLHVDEYTLHA